MIYISTLFRRPGSRNREGCLYVYSDNYKLVAKVYSDAESFRGITKHNGKILIASGTNKIYELNNNELGEAKVYNKCSALHLIYSRDGIIWTTNSANDSIVKISDDGSQVKEKLTPKANKDTLHFNSIAWRDDGDRFHIYNKNNTLVNRSRGDNIVVDKLNAPHDIEFIDAERLLLNNSGDCRTFLINTFTKEIERIIISGTEDRYKSTSECVWSWTRGLCVLREINLAFIGTSPGHIHIFDTKTWDRVDDFIISEDPNESIFDIFVDVE